MAKCIVCRERPAAVPDRNTMSLRKKVCRECHVERLRGDLQRVLVAHVAWLREKQREAEKEGLEQNPPESEFDEAMSFKLCADELESALLKLDAGALFEFVKHGDQEHQDWLREAFEAYVAGRPKPEPRGLGRHGALIADLQSRLDRYKWTPEAYDVLWNRVKALETENDEQRSRLEKALAELAGARCLSSPDGRCQIRRAQEFAGDPREAVSFPVVEKQSTE